MLFNLGSFNFQVWTNNMPRRCVICNAYDKNSDKSFHCFPKDKRRRKLWLKTCGIDQFLPSYRVCEDHFSDEDLLPNGFLTSIAIPENSQKYKQKSKKKKKKSKQPELLESTNTGSSSNYSQSFKETDITELMNLGFSRKQVIQELKRFNGNKNQAMASLFAKILKF